MMSRSSDNEFSRLIYRVVRDGHRTNPESSETSGSGPTPSCSVAALIAGDHLSADQKRHVEECSFCAQLAIRLARAAIRSASITPPDFSL